MAFSPRRERTYRMGLVFAQDLRTHLEDSCKSNAALFAVGGPPHEVCVRVAQPEEVHLGLPQAAMLQQICPLQARSTIECVKRNSRRRPCQIW
jgi:hypothetical protein